MLQQATNNVDNQTEQLPQAFKLALEAMRNKQYQQTIKLCEQQLVEEPAAIPYLQLIAHAYLKLGDIQKSTEQIHFALSLAPDHPSLYEDLGSNLALCNELAPAIKAFKKSVQLNPNQPRVHQKLSKALLAAGMNSEIDEAFENYLDRDHKAAQVAIGAEHWRAGRYQEAETVLKDAVRADANNVNALRFLAAVYLDKGKNLDAEALLRRALKIAPDFSQALQDLGSILNTACKWLEAIETYQQLTQLIPEDAYAWANLAHAYARSGNCQLAIAYYKKSITLKSDSAGIIMTLAHQLKTVGEQDQALRHYRQSITLKPDLAESYWSMANLKMFQFEKSEILAMEQQLENTDLSDEKIVHFHFSLGKAYEDLANYNKAWFHYHEGNLLQRSLVNYDPVKNEQIIDELMSVFTEDFIQQHNGNGHTTSAPIFIVGLPRSGSTLIEQILASHSQVEGTAELPNISSIALATAKYRSDNKRYPYTLMDFIARDWKSYGKEYLDQIAHHRTEKKPYFIDKLPNNFYHIGWIKMIFPNAKIIITRRHPIDSCLGAYKQLFAKGQDFTYDIFELSEYYQNFIKISEHWKKLFPGQILEVHYEDTVTDLETQVHKILDYCGLSFEQQCINFHETKRAVKTASSEQVRMPIYQSALGLWKRYESDGNLDLWKEELADIIQSLPASVKKASN